MPLSDAQKKATKKWHNNNLKNLTISLYKKEYELLDNYCNENNITKSKLIKDRLSDIIKLEE